MSLNRQGSLQPHLRRPLFMLASYMFIVAATACNLPELILIVQSTLTEETVDPFLVLDDNIRLRAICTKPDDKKCYGSQANEAYAVTSLSAIELKDQELKDTVSTHLVYNLGKSSEEEVSTMKAQLSQWFLPDDEYPMGAPLYMGTQQPCSPLSQMDFHAFDEVIPHAESVDEDASDNGSQSERKATLSVHSLDVLSVSQLMESVVETARHVESGPDSSIPLTYDEMKNQCEALVMGKHQKMSVLQSLKEQQESMQITSSHTLVIPNNELEIIEVEGKSFISDGGQGRARVVSCLNEYGQQESFRLPALSPYDKFLKPARF